MSKTLHQFGRVLFDELEQIAVRRGGFASLKWVEKKLLEAQLDIQELAKDAAEPKSTLRRRRRRPRTAPGRQGRAGARGPDGEAVDQLGQIMHELVTMAQEVQNDLVKMAEEARKKIKPPDQAHAPPNGFKIPTDRARAFFDRLRQRRIARPGPSASRRSNRNSPNTISSAEKSGTC